MARLLGNVCGVSADTRASCGTHTERPSPLRHGDNTARAVPRRACLTGSEAIPTLAPAMGPRARVIGLSCLRCRARFDEPRLFTGCPRCRAQGVAVNLSVEYDLSPLAGVT